MENIAATYASLLKNEVFSLSEPAGTAPLAAGSTQAAVAADSFSSVLGQAVGALNDSQLETSQAIAAMVSGEETDIQSVMTQATEAQLSLDLAVQVRNKVLEAYNDIKNMQF